MTQPEVLAESATGSIYDLRYRSYVGPRLGRRHAVVVMLRHGLRAVFGLGRSGRAKLAPLILGGMVVLPAVLSVGLEALFADVAGDMVDRLNPITIEGYLPFVQTMLVFFAAAQAPELLVRDRRHGVLTLYFSRAISRLDYALAKWGAIVAGIGLVLLLPQAILLLADLFATPDLGEGAAQVGPLLVPVLVRTLLVAAVIGGVALVASAFTGRRAFAAGAVIAVFLLSSGIVSVLVEWVDLRGPFGLVALLDPFALLDGASALLFAAEPESRTIRGSDLPVEAFALGAVAVAVGALAAVVLRYQRTAA
jgi:ABC-2 type transport system permease protein